MRTFLVLSKNLNYFTRPPPLTLVLLYCKFLTEIHAVQFDSGIFKEEILFRCKNFLCYARNKNFSPRPPPQHQCYYIVSSLQKITRFNSMVKDLRNKFSLDMNIGLLGLKFSVIITLKGGGGSEKFSFLVSSKNFSYLKKISCIYLVVLYYTLIWGVGPWRKIFVSCVQTKISSI